MSDNKSKLPDFKEVTGMVCKLATDIKNSVASIISDYKKNHPKCEKNTESSSSKDESDKKN